VAWVWGGGGGGRGAVWVHRAESLTVAEELGEHRRALETAVSIETAASQSGARSAVLARLAGHTHPV
jgi:hypothetical protein